jgi:hypothetical protein
VSNAPSEKDINPNMISINLINADHEKKKYLSRNDYDRKGSINEHLSPNAQAAEHPNTL